MPYFPTPEELKEIGLTPQQVRETSGGMLYKPAGCEQCNSTGYRGRSGIYELFPISEDARSLILRRAPTREIRRAALEAGMVTLRLDGWAKACAGVTTVEEVLRVTQEDA